MERFRHRIAPRSRPIAACLALLALTACASTGPRSSEGPARSIECVPYARARSGLPLYGNAATWWQQAAGRFARSHQPEPGAVLVFRATGRLPDGHVSTVVRLRSPREIVVDHANWVRGHVGHADPVVDVSPANDWTDVRVWWDPSGQMGATTYPTYGFVLPAPAADDRVAALAPDPSQCRVD